MKIIDKIKFLVLMFIIKPLNNIFDTSPDGLHLKGGAHLSMPKNLIRMSLITKLLVGLIVLAIVDIVIPIPIVAIILIYVILQKPDWFLEIVNEVYGNERK